METKWPARLCAPAVVLLLMAMGAFSAPAQTFEEAVAAHERGDHAAGYRGFRVHAEQGNADAQFNLGVLYANGKGVPQDYAEAMKWYRQSAEQDNASAQFNLGVLYYDGKGVPQDYAEAAKWSRRAADQGDADAQFGLGYMYYKGRGVPQDFVQAHMWLNLATSRLTASEKDLRQATQDLRDEVASRMTPADLALAQRLAQEWRPNVEIRVTMVLRLLSPDEAGQVGLEEIGELESIDPGDLASAAEELGRSHGRAFDAVFDARQAEREARENPTVENLQVAADAWDRAANAYGEFAEAARNYETDNTNFRATLDRDIARAEKNLSVQSAHADALREAAKDLGEGDSGDGDDDDDGPTVDPDDDDISDLGDPDPSKEDNPDQ